jgi:endoglucanase
LPAGQQDFAITAAAGGFNINWFSISANSVAPIGQTVWLKGTNNLFASSENGTQAMRCNRATVGGWEQFTVVDAGGGKVALRSQNKYVSSENGTQAITCNRATIGDWEKFDWVVNADGRISLRGINGKYVSSENGTQAMTCTRTTIGGWETFAWGTGTGRQAAPQMNSELTSNPADEDSVYPNPSSGTVTIKVAKPSAVRVLDSAGKVIFSDRIETTHTLENINSGMYLIKIKNKDGMTVKKLVVN